MSMIESEMGLTDNGLRLQRPARWLPIYETYTTRTVRKREDASCAMRSARPHKAALMPVWVPHACQACTSGARSVTTQHISDTLLIPAFVLILVHQFVGKHHDVLIHSILLCELDDCMWVGR